MSGLMHYFHLLHDKVCKLYFVPHGSHNAIVPLEGLRAVAAFMVFIVHYSAQFTPWIDKNSITWELIIDYRYIGANGVELFFVISGFLIYGMLMKRNEPFVLYFKRRLKRIYPTFLAVFSLYLILSFLFPSESKLPDSLLATFEYILINLLMLPGFLPLDPMIGVAWSLSYEMFFYLFIPLIIFISNFRKWPSHYRIFILLLISAGGFILSYNDFNSHDKMLLFISGMLLYEIKTLKDKSSVKHPFGPTLFITIITLLIVKHADMHDVFELLTLFIGFFFVCLSCFDNQSLFSKFCSSSLMRSYGNMSYSYYLIHGLTLKFFFLILGFYFPPNNQWDLILYFLFIPAFVLTWITSTILFLLIEKPLSLTKKTRQEPIKVES